MVSVGLAISDHTYPPNVREKLARIRAREANVKSGLLRDFYENQIRDSSLWKVTSETTRSFLELDKSASTDRYKGNFEIRGQFSIPQDSLPLDFTLLSGKVDLSALSARELDISATRNIFRRNFPGFDYGEFQSYVNVTKSEILDFRIGEEVIPLIRLEWATQDLPVNKHVSYCGWVSNGNWILPPQELTASFLNTLHLPNTTQNEAAPIWLEYIYASIGYAKSTEQIDEMNVISYFQKIDEAKSILTEKTANTKALVLLNKISHYNRKALADP